MIATGFVRGGMATRKKQADAPVARLRRMYIDGRFGQLHVTAAYPASGGFDEATPLLCLHAEGGTGADFNRAAALLGADRSVYAPDLPGSGHSDAGSARPTIADLAQGVVDLIDELRLRRVDLVGCGRGALVAYELAAGRPKEVRRLVVAGLQQPATAIPQPMLHLSPDPARFQDEAVDAAVAEVRAFLDRP